MTINNTASIVENDTDGGVALPEEYKDKTLAWKPSRSSSPQIEFSESDPTSNSTSPVVSETQEAYKPPGRRSEILKRGNWRQKEANVSSSSSESFANNFDRLHIGGAMGNFQSHTERPGLWSSENAALPPLRKSIAPTRKKTHCDKWIQTGTCAFSQQGCIFKHEMPDPQTLGKWFGSTSIPIWYVKRTSQAYLQLQDGVKRGLADLRERGDGDEWSKADKERVRELAVWVLGKALMEGVEDEELEGRIWDAVLR